jgi:hypothetical protein
MSGYSSEELNYKQILLLKQYLKINLFLLIGTAFSNVILFLLITNDKGMKLEVGEKDFMVMMI